MSVTDEIVAIASPVPSITAALEPDVPDAFQNLDYGPAVFHRRREQWQRGQLKGFGLASAPVQQSSSSFASLSARFTSSTTGRTTSSGDALKRLDDILADPDVDDDEDVWRTYLGDIYKRMVGGSRIKRGLKLSQGVRILQIGWKRDGTWYGAQAPPESGVASAFAPAPHPKPPKSPKDFLSFVKSPRSRLKTEISPSDLLRGRDSKKASPSPTHNGFGVIR